MKTAARERVAVRQARRGEAMALGHTGWRSFRSGTPEGWSQFYGDAFEMVPDDTLVAEADGGALAGHATALRLTMSLCGEDVPMRGIAGVAVVPEFRRRGVADALMVAWLRRLRRRGDALSLLYPFRASFYRKFGYGTVEWSDHVRVRPAQLPGSALRRKVRVLDRDRDEAGVRKAYEASRAETTGPLRRTDIWWRERVFKRVPEGAVFADGAGRIAGYLLYEVPADPTYPRQHCLVKELVATTPDAWRALLGFLEALGDQFLMIELALPRGEAVALLTDFGVVDSPSPLRLFQIGSLQGTGAMARLVDAPAALALHPGPARHGVRGRLGLDLEDPVFPAQSRAFDVVFGSRETRMTPGRNARERLCLGVDRLSQIYMAAVSARMLLAHGQVDGSPHAADLLDRAFAGPVPFLYPLNGF